MKAYISVSFNKRNVLEKEISAIKNTLAKSYIDSFVFVDNYNFKPENEHKMMQQVMDDIDSCDFLIAETTEKGIGIGIEAGYAKAKNKIVVYLRHSSAEHSTTLSGISDFRIIYKYENDLVEKLSVVISEIIKIN